MTGVGTIHCSWEDLFPNGDTKWENYLLLLIADYLSAHGIHPDEVAHMKDFTEDHHSAFINLYPDASIIPKMHNVVHMPQRILQQVHIQTLQLCFLIFHLFCSCDRY